MTVLLWGLPAERPLAAVREALARLGTPALVLDQGAVAATAVDLAVGPDVRGALRLGGRRVDLRAIGAVYLRPYDPRQLPAVARAGPRSATWRRAHAVGAALYAWAEVTPALVLNRPSAGAANGSKPYQAELIRRLGFAVPETLITTDPEAARAFWAEHAAVVYKSVSGVRSIVSRLGPEHAARLADVANCPTMFQRHIPGVDHRVHVVGDAVFACAIGCAADDYRYPGSRPVDIRVCRLPPDVEGRCRALAAALGLPLAGIDLRRDAAGAWYCFEVNPSPAFTYYEAATGQPLADAVARLLAAGAAGLPPLQGQPLACASAPAAGVRRAQ